ncbi:putative prefoldin subunit 4 [Pseudolycoriella hygida]|uniref:Prefoldin subunit 4 n=1 Tax=Pseudolycoriella hygida TaxID=35572 RepID=A0A9Q0N2G6_9DIPT|nr:putative prefoldin subunit 4 [Pseudolycoriella hygida]
MASKVTTNGKVFKQDTDVHVTYEDQSKINKFAKHNAKLEDLKDELETKKNDLRNLEEAADEIELFDEDDQIPFVVGEVFISQNLSKTQELLVQAKEKKLREIKKIEEKCREIQGLMAELKAQLYHRFGSNIYLENDE